MENIEESKLLVGERVRAIRERFNVTQKELAVILGFGGDTPDRAVYLIEHGERGLTKKKMEILIEEYNLNPEYLMLKSDLMTVDDLWADGYRELTSEGQAMNGVLKMAARSAGYSMKVDHISLKELPSKKCYHFIFEDGNERSFTSAEVETYILNVRWYAEKLFERMMQENSISWKITDTEMEVEAGG